MENLFLRFEGTSLAEALTPSKELRGPKTKLGTSFAPLPPSTGGRKIIFIQGYRSIR
jgi:hypothetical protein